MKYLFVVIGCWSVMLVVFVIVVVVVLFIWKCYEICLWMCDGWVCVDVVCVVLDMGGLVIQVLVYDNQWVSVGQLLLVLDQLCFVVVFEKVDVVVSSVCVMLVLVCCELMWDNVLGNFVVLEICECNVVKVDIELVVLVQVWVEQCVVWFNV